MTDEERQKKHEVMANLVVGLEAWLDSIPDNTPNHSIFTCLIIKTVRFLYECDREKEVASKRLNEAFNSIWDMMSKEDEEFVAKLL